ncbi:MAG: 4-(cytidine 5'-diphospho)-2-C-methyl-D-erythritol kinase [Alicyclobacillus sp.]|nr:4-(cytidine 5'-diphospho)-2-C-methyl-D-erythritol kinase [Alicyclobacillus sp.]
MGLVEHAFAKINLSLDVLGRRPDGYHEVDMVMQTVDLADLVFLEDNPDEDITLEVQATHVPQDERNLAYAAARLFRERSGVRRGVHIRLDKHIPVAAGLAGGSADAAAVLRGLNRLWGTGLSLDQLAEWGASIGSDVPFCVYQGCARVRGRGEQVQPFQHGLRLWTVLVRPPVFVSTADVYHALTERDFVSQPRSAAVMRALRDDDWLALRGAVHNSMAAAARRLYPEIESFHSRVEEAAQVPFFMSGSGPTLFALLPAESHARRVRNALMGFLREVYLCRFVGGL